MRIYIYMCVWCCLRCIIHFVCRPKLGFLCCSNRFYEGGPSSFSCICCIPFNGMSVNENKIINVLSTNDDGNKQATQHRPNICSCSSELVLFETFYHKERWNIATLLQSVDRNCGNSNSSVYCVCVSFLFIVCCCWFIFLLAHCNCTWWTVCIYIHYTDECNNPCSLYNQHKIISIFFFCSS